MSSARLSSAQPPSQGNSTPAVSTSSSNTNTLYALASRVPMVKSPSISVPPPITLPQDLHPLPPDIAAYFVYPFSLESYVLDPNTPSSTTIEKLHERHRQYLEAREQQKQDRQREALRRLAPGWDGGQTGVLQPTSKQPPNPAQSPPTSADQTQQPMLQQPSGISGTSADAQERTPLDDLADHLAQLDAMSSSRPSALSPTSNGYASYPPS
ncbi:hypothetical protein BCV70DRAFT_201230 [Testicularia cyperi]|uniref:Uncharacterized protein n=1 Tax=Testicularia cyperi TaxID=1882483 RepID=A0A317XLR6_9BASI|nr:hypothetical protein BCV70DRAFT_201230 [Testicularia cyperi]